MPSCGASTSRPSFGSATSCSRTSEAEISALAVLSRVMARAAVTTMPDSRVALRWRITLRVKFDRSSTACAAIGAKPGALGTET
jgi:hypothetical protein